MSSTATRKLSVAFRLHPYPAEISRAREPSRKALADWGLNDHTDLAELIVTELATNALQHGTGHIQIRLSYFTGDLWTEVHDDGVGRPVRHHPTAEAEHGRGMALIDDLIAMHGGTPGVVDDPEGPGKTVYVAVSLSDCGAES